MITRGRLPRRGAEGHAVRLRRRPAAVTLVLFAIALLVIPAPVHAQQGGAADARTPLQKSDVIRLLTGSTYSKDEIAGIISRSCLTFVPTPRDIEDFQGLGADDAITEAIRVCSLNPGALELTVARQSISGPSGGEATLDVEVTRNGRPRSGVRVELSGMQTVPGGADDAITATTDAQGRASLSVPAGTTRGTYRLFLVASEGDDQASMPVFLSTTAGAPTRAEVSPSPLLLAEGALGDEAVTVTLLDQFGSPAGDVEVALRPALAGMLMGEVTGTSDALGRVRLAVTPSELRDGDSLSVFVGDREIGGFRVTVHGPSDQNSGFVAGLNQRGAAGAVLDEPLVFEVKDADGRAVGGQRVTFTATNGSVQPPAGATDDVGRISVVVTLGMPGSPTRVTARTGTVARAAVFESQPAEPQRAGDERLDEARALAAGGEFAGAAAVYRSILAGNPTNVDALVELGHVEGALGEYSAAIESFRAALRVDPDRADAQAGVGYALLGEGKPGEAIPWLEFATRGNPSDGHAWVALGSAYAVDGQQDMAREAFEQALVIDPTDQQARDGLESLGPLEAVLELAAWGGNTFDNGRGVGLRMFQVAGRPIPALRLWFRFDNALNLDVPLFAPLFVRGPDDIEAFYGGLAYDWGSNQRFKTSFQAGRRNHPPAPGTTETVWQLEQGVKFPSGAGNNILWSFGGLLGHYFDRDDWMAYTRVGVPVGRSWLIEPGIYVGKTAGSNIVDSGRQPEEEVRGILWVRYRPASGWVVDPAIGYGNVNSDLPGFSGSLFEGQLRLGAPIGKVSLIELFVRYQNPPGSNPFTTFALGFNLGIPGSTF